MNEMNIDELERRKTILQAYADSIGIKINTCSKKDAKRNDCSEMISRRNAITMEISKINDVIKAERKKGR